MAILVSSCRCVCQHFGTKNESVQDRLALFSVFTPFAEPRQDDYQIFRYAPCAQLPVPDVRYHSAACPASVLLRFADGFVDFALAVVESCCSEYIHRLAAGHTSTTRTALSRASWRRRSGAIENFRRSTASTTTNRTMRMCAS